MTATTIRRGFVLLSGGLDSTTLLHMAMKELEPHAGAYNAVKLNTADCDWIEAFSIDYGQRHRKEMDYAESTCEELGVSHSVIPLTDILGSSMLTDSSIKIPNASYSELPHGVSPTYVPNRNMVMLSCLVAKAQLWVNQELKQQELSLEDKVEASVYYGAHAEDAQNWAYPDCTPEFIGAMSAAIYIATYHHVRLHTPLMWLTKSQIVEIGYELGVVFSCTWSCYAGGEYHCGVCPTCRARKEAFAIAKIPDPTIYFTER